MLEIAGLEAGYGPLPVLHGVSLRAAPGVITALVGPNGAGKTTLLRAVAGLIPARAGEIRLEATRLNPVPAHERPRLGVVLVPEGRRLFGDQTILDNLLLGASWRVRRDGLRRVTAEARELLARHAPALAPRAHQLAAALSGGEQQLVAILRGLMARPRVLLLDEPSLGLAPQRVRDVFALLQQIAAEGLTILLVEQMVQQALQVASAAYVLDRGRVVLAGTPAELRDHPELLAAYLGAEARA
jgi:ABC-type branched-subunit amino acid transport system ATPase component